MTARSGRVLVAAAATAGLVLTLGACSPQEGPTPSPETGTQDASAPDTQARTPQQAGEAFLDDYVDPDGRVVRRDQGDDTVSEAQAYGMLVAVGVDDAERFASIWEWTQENLQRPDGLLSWQWDDGEVTDDQPAADADLDAARALALAAERFDEPGYATDAQDLGAAVLDLETAPTALGLVLLAGPWADVDPYQINPSYPTPVATRLLAELDGDPRWAELDAGNRAVTRALTEGARSRRTGRRSTGATAGSSRCPAPTGATSSSATTPPAPWCASRSRATSRTATPSPRRSACSSSPTPWPPSWTSAARPARRTPTR
ncbi:glycosyl hydrolase family 8 [Litorihabitans aurantiacus]|uniref:Cellulase n=1 Tax=Litorihabitans aurantiacus TaxID=1930061 RepID=A0AA38CS87_9MICO|nr:glycosyl hydrolase family 8 [Litorihabitans aurantiacus]GMA32336.1 hypothetical protein GCM10025875_23280 [Litorihabitans aurantiacus]